MRWLAAFFAAMSCVFSAQASEVITYQYDVHGRLIQVNHSGTVNDGLQSTYSYDPADNRTSVAVVGGWTCGGSSSSALRSALKAQNKAQNSAASETVAAIPTMTKTVIVTSGTSLTTPSDWCWPWSITAIGGGASGRAGGVAAGGAGGGAGAFAQINQGDAVITPGQTIYYAIGNGGAAASSGAGNSGGDTWVNFAANVPPEGPTEGVLAKGGAASLATTSGGIGGQASESIGSTTFNGGGGGAPSLIAPGDGSGGGGAAGPRGPGGNGGGAGGAGGGSGGNGGAGGLSTSTGNGGGGAAGTDYVQTGSSAVAGAGGGGGGAAGKVVSTGPSGGSGALYGGAGGGGGGGTTTGGTSGVGAAGVLVLAYTVPRPITVDYLIAAGGGGGGAGIGGGGGAGGILTANDYTAPTGTPLTVTIGAGGTGGTGGENPSRGGDGGNSSFNGIAAAGGGGGGAYVTFYPNTGGSGGGRGAADSGSAASGTSGQGNAGGISSGNGWNGAGGGGGGAVGGNAGGYGGAGGAGGIGLQSAITGTAIYYGGGGGGGGRTGIPAGAGGSGGGGAGSISGVGTAGTANTGGGGGAGGYNGDMQAGGNGGSGVVIIRYLEGYPAATTTGSPTVTVSGGYRIYKFTANGTITLPYSGTYDPSAEIYFAAMTVQRETARKTLINNLIVGLKNDGLWTKLAWMSLLASHDAQAARLNAVTPSQSFTVNGTLSFTADRGYRAPSASASNYLDAGVTLSNGGVASQNSLFIGSWLRSDGSSSWRGAVGSHTSPYAYMINAETTLYGALNDGNNVTYSSAPLGFSVVSRTGATTKKLYKNGSLVGSNSDATSSMTGGHVRALSTPLIATDGTHMIATWGAGLSDTEVSNLYARLNTYLTAIGAN